MNTEAWRAPDVPEDEAIVSDEPGRVLEMGKHRVCYSAYHYRVTRADGAFYTLRVKHGGGEESIRLSHGFKYVAVALEKLTSDERFLALHELRDVRRKADRDAEDRTAGVFRSAFADGRLKKRKLRGQASVKVWIEPAAA